MDITKQQWSDACQVWDWAGHHVPGLREEKCPDVEPKQWDAGIPPKEAVLTCLWLSAAGAEACVEVEGVLHGIFVVLSGARKAAPLLQATSAALLQEAANLPQQQQGLPASTAMMAPSSRQIH